MNGAEILLRVAASTGIDVCFANPGTSEMHFVSALDRVPSIRSILGLFEGVVTGAADGYARMADRPALTLLHLGPGLAYGSPNLHNARRARSPVVNIVGDHATYHRQHDAPLTSDIEGTARPFCDWVRTSTSVSVLAHDAMAAIAAAMDPPGKIATLILPADVAWGEADAGAVTPAIVAPNEPAKPSQEAIDQALRILGSGEPTTLLLGGKALREKGLHAAGLISQATGARLFAQTHNGRIERGANRVPIERIPYGTDLALDALKGTKHLILVGSKAPVAFFAYPNKPSRLSPDSCQVHSLAQPHEDAVHALAWIADEIGVAHREPKLAPLALPAQPTGAITPEKIGLALGALLPEGGIVADESVSTGRAFFPPTRTARPHDWLQITGGAIGCAMSLAVGAATACPNRKVICLQGDGSGMYTPQALWTQARERLDITTVIFANRTYQILRNELINVGANPGPRSLDMLDIGRPDLSWVGLARSMGVEANRATTMEEFAGYFAAGLSRPGPYLLEVAV